MKIIANLKMNKTPSQTLDYFMNIVPKSSDFKHELIFCVPFTSLTIGKYLTQNTNIQLGAQNLSDEDEGACTGEISGSMIKDAGANFVIIGHSERRSKFKENNKLINKKIKMALKNRLTSILCIGESLAEKNTLKTADVLKEQLEEGLKGIYENELENIIIAYEPIWAIGTGKIPTVKEISNSIDVIRKVIAQDFSLNAGKNICVVYGGSVNNKNISQIGKVKNINGFLVGGASLEPSGFLQLITSVSD